MVAEPSLGQQLGQSAVGPAGRDPLADVGEVRTSVDAVQATGRDDGVQHGRVSRTRVGARKQVVLPTHRDRPFILPMSVRP